MVRLSFIVVIAILGLAGCCEIPVSVASVATEAVAAQPVVVAAQPVVVAAQPVAVAAQPVVVAAQPVAVAAQPVVMAAQRSQRIWHINTAVAEEKAEALHASVINSGIPLYTYRLTNIKIARDHEEHLSVIVSLKLSQDQLIQRLEDWQKALQTAHAVVGKGSLQNDHWSKFKFIQAKIRCPPLLKCGPDSYPKSIVDDPLIWDWTLNSTQWDKARNTSITVDFYGGQSINDKFNEGIDTLPPLKIDAIVDYDLKWWENSFNQLKDFFTSIYGMLIVFIMLITYVLDKLDLKASRKRA